MKILTIFAVLFLFSCGTIVTGTQQKVIVHTISDASKQEVFLNGKLIEDFNGEIIIDKKNSTNFLTIKSDGYYEVNQYFNRDVNHVAIAGDSLWLIAAPIALAIDFYTGGVYQITPDNIRIVLRKKEKI